MMDRIECNSQCLGCMQIEHFLAIKSKILPSGIYEKIRSRKITHFFQEIEKSRNFSSVISSSPVFPSRDVGKSFIVIAQTEQKSIDLYIYDPLIKSNVYGFNCLNTNYVISNHAKRFIIPLKKEQKPKTQRNKILKTK